ncbi:MAG: YceI family protein [Actinomycetota bacterium]
MTSHPTALPDGSWTLDPDRTTVTVAVKKLGLLNVSATLDLIDGTIDISDGQVDTVDARVSATSYRSPNAKRNEHVIGSDFLDTASHPEIAFRTTSVEPADDGYVASGTVNVKGKDALLRFDVHDITAENNTASFSATASVDRTTIGVDKMPSLIIGRMLDLTISAHAQRVDPDSGAGA